MDSQGGRRSGHPIPLTPLLRQVQLGSARHAHTPLPSEEPVMRLVSWNCRMALQRKLPALLTLNPDIAILPEAGDTAHVPLSLDDPRSSTYLWTGRNRSKGLGVLARDPYRIELACAVEERLEWILPIRVTGPVDFVLLAVWAMNHRATNKYPDGNQDRQALQALDVYADLLAEAPVVVAGDFNNAVLWDRPGNSGNFANMVEALTNRGLVSAYHQAKSIVLGEEADPTLYWRSQGIEGRTYHIDYCFVPEAWSDNTRAEVGSHTDWVGSGLSDHVPVVVDVDLPVGST